MSYHGRDQSAQNAHLNPQYHRQNSHRYELPAKPQSFNVTNRAAGRSYGQSWPETDYSSQPLLTQTPEEYLLAYRSHCKQQCEHARPADTVELPERLNHGYVKPARYPARYPVGDNHCQRGCHGGCDPDEREVSA